MVRLIVAHRSTLVRDVMRILGTARDILVVAETNGPEELVELCLTELPDVVVAEGDYDGGQIESALPAVVSTGARVVVVCDDPSPARLVTIVAGGASGWLRHDVAPAELLDAVDAVASGMAVFDPPAARTILDDWRRLRAHVGAGLPGAHGGA